MGIGRGTKPALPQRMKRTLQYIFATAVLNCPQLSTASGLDQELIGALNELVITSPTPDNLRYWEAATARPGQGSGQASQASHREDLRWLQICAEFTKGRRNQLQACLDARYTEYQEEKSDASQIALLASVINDTVCLTSEDSFKACIKALNAAAALLLEPKQLSRRSLKLTPTEKPLGDLIAQASDTSFMPKEFEQMGQSIVARRRVPFTQLLNQITGEAVETNQRSAMAAVALNTFQVHTRHFQAEKKNNGLTVFAGWGNGRYDECNPIQAGCWRQPPLWYRFELETRVREIGVRINGPEMTIKFIHGGEVGAQGIYVPDEFYDPQNQVILRPETALYWTARIRQKQQGVNISYSPRWDHGTWFIQTEAGIYVYRLKMWVVGRHLNYDQGPAFNTVDGYLTQTGYKATVSAGATIGRKLTDDLAFYCNLTFFKEVKKKDAPAGGTNGQWGHAIFKKAGLQTGTCGLEYAIN